MTWYSNHFFWIPAAGEYQQSVHLYINDGWQINLDMDDCTATPDHFDCYDESHSDDKTALRRLTIDQLKELSAACIKAIDYYNTKDLPPNLGKK